MKSLTETQEWLEQDVFEPVTPLPMAVALVMPGRFTVVEAVAFKQDFQHLCTANAALKQVKFDFTATTFLDSSGIGALVSCWKIAQNRGIELVLQNLSRQILSILEMADVLSLFRVEASTRPSVSIEPIITHPSLGSPVKRLMDIAGAVVGLSATALLIVPIAVAIKLDSPGPILFSQTRCSWMGRRFKMWKFRSMVIDAEAQKHLVENESQGAFFKSTRDPRVTRVGRLLRKTSLDELPQFWNVLRGEMSLVGTRPPTPDEVNRYEIPQWQRLDIKPGMTGEWQVNGRSKITEFAQVVQLDLRYQERWSLSYDCKILVKTVMVLFRKNTGAV
jgi:anti-anti-sigma factor